MWLIAATGMLALTILVLAVAETNLRAHYLIDQGEYISMFGLAFILVAGLLPVQPRAGCSRRCWLIFPWLLYPVVTQGDQIIDNLSINPMRAICHVLLAAIFATPVAVIVMLARYLLAPKPGRPTDPARLDRAVSRIAAARRRARARRQRAAGGRAAGDGDVAGRPVSRHADDRHADHHDDRHAAVRFAAGPSRGAGSAARPDGADRADRCCSSGVALSAAGFFGYKNRTGAYQGSPAAFMDPAQQETGLPARSHSRAESSAGHARVARRGP